MFCVENHDTIIAIIMREFKKKNQYSFWHSPIILGVLFCILVIFSFNVIKLIEKERLTSRNKIIELNKIEELKQREASLNSDIEKLGTDNGIEDTIRNKFPVAKPGEKVVSIVDEEEKKPIIEEENNHGFWSWIKGMFSK